MISLRVDVDRDWMNVENVFYLVRYLIDVMMNDVLEIHQTLTLNLTSVF
jgi:hypothetical protein